MPAALPARRLSIEAAALPPPPLAAMLASVCENARRLQPLWFHPGAVVHLIPSPDVAGPVWRPLAHAATARGPMNVQPLRCSLYGAQRRGGVSDFDSAVIGESDSLLRQQSDAEEECEVCGGVSERAVLPTHH